MKTIIIIQARMGSERLPGKVLLSLGSSNVLHYVVSRCKEVELVDEVIVATSLLPADDAIEEWCEKMAVPCFRGSEKDVLSRYYECALSYQPDYVIRVTGDCPFVDYHTANDIVKLLLQEPCDLVAIEAESELTRGLIVEAVSLNTLKYMYENGTEERHREHVTYYAKEYPEKFSAIKYVAPSYMQQSHLRITLDTPEDYELCNRIADNFKDDLLIPASDVVEYLLEHPEIAQINAHIEQKPVV